MSDAKPHDPVESFVREVKATRKYRCVCEDTIRDVIRTALPKYSRTRDAIRSARTKLHRIQAMYLGKHAIDEHLGAVREAHDAGDTDRLRAICLRLMRDHASTRERIPLLDRFYAAIFAVTGVPAGILDVACGVHPLSIPWMGLPEDTPYHAYEIAGDLVECVNGFLEAVGMKPLAKFQDVLCEPPRERADLAFLMKMAPCLERRQKGTTIRLLDTLRVRYVVVSFPVRSLSGRSKHMPEFYTRSFTDMVAGTGWTLTEVPIDGELVFVVDKGGSPR